MNNNKWKLAYTGEALIISSGLVYTQTTKPKGLKLADIKQMIKESPNSSYYQKGIKRRVTLGDSIGQKDSNMIGKEVEFFSSINLIHPEHDRVFVKMPTTGKQLISKTYSSKPIKL